MDVKQTISSRTLVGCAKKKEAEPMDAFSYAKQIVANDQFNIYMHLMRRCTFCSTVATKSSNQQRTKM